MGIAIGDQVEVKLELHADERVVDVPDDLARALAKDRTAKKDETRTRRLGKTLEMLKAGTKHP